MSTSVNTGKTVLVRWRISNVLAALQASGEFDTVSLSFRAPFGPRRGVGVVPEGGGSDKPLQVGANGVSDTYFRVLSIPIVRGRAFTFEEGQEPVMVHR